MNTASVFPLEIYEHILELFVETWSDESHVMQYTFCYVCTAWRWKCRSLAFRNLMLAEESVDMMQIMRRKFTANPHLATLVENIELHILFPGDPYQSLIEGFPSMLGRFLPRLRRVSIISCIRPLRIHRLFSIRRVLLHTVTVLEVSNVLFGKHFTFKWFIAPFPSLRVLSLWKTAWEVAPDLNEGMPPLTELELGIRGGNEWRAVWTKENREAYEYLLNASHSTLRSFSVNIFSLYILTALHDYKSEVIRLNALEVLSLELHARRDIRRRAKDGKDPPYHQCVADIISLLTRLDAKRTRVLNLSFDISHGSFIVSDDDFLDSLRNVRKGLEDLVVGNYFPSLKTIYIIVVGAGEAAVPIWQDRFNSCFPLLAERGLLRVEEYIYRE